MSDNHTLEKNWQWGPKETALLYPFTQMESSSISALHGEMEASIQDAICSTSCF